MSYRPWACIPQKAAFPTEAIARYYARRAAGGAGLITTEATYIDHARSGHNRGYLRLSSPESIEGWREVVRQVHAAGGLIVPEIWHVGLVYLTEDILSGNPLTYNPELQMVSASGYIMPELKVDEPMTIAQIEEVIESFGRAAANARAIGFDGIELHGAHGYLIDQFFWSGFNRREDDYGGSVRKRARFGAEVIREVRRQVGPDFPIFIRLSQWKMQDYDARVAKDPHEMEEWLEPLVDAGVDVIDCSQRRFWEPEFAGSHLNFAGWAKKVNGLPTITVGSVGLDAEMLESLAKGADAAPVSLDRLMDMLRRQECDMVGVGRSLIADPDWPRKVASGRFEDLVGFTPAILAQPDSQLSYLNKNTG